MGSLPRRRPNPWIRPFLGLMLGVVLILQLFRVLFSMGFYRPGRVFRALKSWRLFSRAEEVSRAWMDANLPLESCSPTQRRRLLRYARNTLGLVVIQPRIQQAGWFWSPRECAIGTAYGLCIPLYDDCFDEVSLASAQAFGQAFHRSLSGELWRPELVPDGMSDSPEVLRNICVVLWSQIETPYKRRFTELLREMNEAQIESLEEHIEGTDTELLREISARKGVASFNLLLAALGDLDAHRDASLTGAAVWAQWMDDYDDLESDRAQGSFTYIAHLEEGGGALQFVQDELRRVIRSLEHQFGSDGRLFADVLALNFVVKTAHQRTLKTARGWGAAGAMPRFFWKGPSLEDSGSRTDPQPPIPTP